MLMSCCDIWYIPVRIKYANPLVIIICREYVENRGLIFLPEEYFLI